MNAVNKVCQGVETGYEKREIVEEWRKEPERGASLSCLKRNG